MTTNDSSKDRLRGIAANTGRSSTDELRARSWRHDPGMERLLQL